MYRVKPESVGFTGIRACARPQALLE